MSKATTANEVRTQRRRAAAARGQLVARCPRDGRPVDIGIDTDYESLCRSWSRHIDFKCPHCGQSHVTTVRDTYIATAIAQLSLD